MSSGNSLDCSPEDMTQLHANEAAVKEMEAAGISWVCLVILTLSVEHGYSPCDFNGGMSWVIPRRLRSMVLHSPCDVQDAP